ncbi:MAG: isoprenoid biosynthesis glyoxalase ElbB, partial [Opitutales bacterium]|nr:isoprenoid biosynthesis glyoxalase ElbB [Opitutales bacterium]
MPKVGVVLSGCGVFDGAEIHESVLTLLALDKAGAEILCFAPDIPQTHVIQHNTGAIATGETRNVLSEAARITRGVIEPLSNAHPSLMDAIIFPGGFGVAKNLSSFAFQGADCTIEPDVARILRDMHSWEKPIGMACIAPVIAAKLFGAEVTIGNDPATAEAIRQMGGKHIEKGVTEIHVDDAHRIVTTPAYMCQASVSEVAIGIERMVHAVLDMVR